jgi:hypothetical protein
VGFLLAFELEPARQAARVALSNRDDFAERMKRAKANERRKKSRFFFKTSRTENLVCHTKEPKRRQCNTTTCSLP